MNALSASSDEVVACSIGASNFWIDCSDSPSRARISEAAPPSVASTVSREAASFCTDARLSPEAALIAFSVRT